MIKTQVLVPTRDNDGRAFGRSAWRELERRLLAFGGYSRESGVFGGWTDASGRLYNDTSRQYTVALESWLDLAAWLAVVQWARTAFRQDALFIEVAGIPEVADGARQARGLSQS